MKRMGTPPPKSKENEQLLKEAMALKMSEIMKDQSTEFATEANPGICCEECGEPYEIGKGFIWDYSGCWTEVWCEPCFSVMAARMLAERHVET